MTVTRRFRSFAAMLPLCALAGNAAAQTIHAIPPIPGGGFTRVYGVNANGTAAAGYSDNASGQDIAIRWTLSGGTGSMGFLPGGSFNSYAQAINGDGSVLVGYGDSGGMTRAFKWTTSGGYQILPFASGTSGFNRANAVSQDGLVVVGTSGLGANANGFTWDTLNFVNPILPFNICSTPGTGNTGLAVSGNGLVIGGTCGNSAVKRTYVPSSQLGGITGFPGQQWQMAEAISADGSIFTGRYSPSTGGEFGFRYGLTVPGFVQALPPTPNGCTALRPRAINGDGTVIVGQVFDNVAGLTGFIWTPSVGTQLASAHLAARAVNLTGWTITDITGISPDGRHMSGYGIFNGNARGFVVRNLPCPGLNSPIGTFGDNGCLGGFVVMGVNFSFQVGSDASNRFRWFRNGVQILDGIQPSGSSVSGATTQNLTITNTQVADAGSYTVEISALGACPTVSAPYVLNGPAVLSQNINPVSGTACLGQSPSLFAVPSAPSIPPSSVTYQWQKFVGPLPTNWVNVNDGPTGNGSTYFGATTSTFSVFNAQGPDSGLYRCVFGVLGCGTGQITSSSATLTIIDSLPAVNGPFDTSICPGDNDAFFSVSASPCVGCTYRWQRYDPCPFINCFTDIFDGPTGNGGFYGGTGTPNLTIGGVYPGDFTQYRCIINMPCAGNVPSGEATLFAVPEASFNGLPVIDGACIGGTGTITVNASPLGTTYQWQRFVGPCINCWQNIADGPSGNGSIFSGTQSPTLSIQGLNFASAGTIYRCIAYGPCAITPAVTGELQLPLYAAPSLQTDAVGGLICKNGSKTLSVALNPGVYGTVTYQWWRYVPAFPIFAGVPNGTLPSGAMVVGANSPSMTISNFQPQDAGQYYCQITTSACGTLNSSVVNLTSCFADFNCSGFVTLQDIFDFLNAWFAGAASADINGVGGVSLQDVFDFLNAWFAGC